MQYPCFRLDMLYIIPVVEIIFRLCRITDTPRCFSQRFEMTVIYDNRYAIYLVLSNAYFR